MSTLLDCYRILGVSVGSGLADVTSSYKKLCRLYHPDVNDDPESEELMKRINTAYAVVREKLKREAALRERAAYARSLRKYTYANKDAAHSGSAETRKTSADVENEAYSVIHGYFNAISAYDYSGAYNFISAYDKRQISRESFIEWRISVARLYPMREFTVENKSKPATVTFNDDKKLFARKFRVAVTEEDVTKNTTNSDDIEKLVINENSQWRVFLGYRGVYELTRVFDDRFEDRLKRDIAERIEEYSQGLHAEYNMLNLTGMSKAASREIYRQKRFGGALTLAVISVKASGVQEAGKEAGQEELLRSAAGTINSSLRETDTPAYAGDGVFVLLFVELSKKNAESIISRLASDIRNGAGQQLGGQAQIDYAFEAWSGGKVADMDALSKVLKKFGKKL